jgi:hypothetical protein
MGVTIDDARAIAAALPRSYEALVRDEVRFRVGRMVYAAFYHDDTIMGFGFPRDERQALVASEPDKFLKPRPLQHAVPVGLRTARRHRRRRAAGTTRRRVAHVRAEKVAAAKIALTLPTGVVLRSNCRPVTATRAGPHWPNKSVPPVAHQWCASTPALILDNT